MADMYAQIIGDKQLLANLNALAPKVKKRIMKPAMRKGGQVIAKRAKLKIPKRSGFLRKALRALPTKNGNVKIYVNPKVSGWYKEEFVRPAKYAHLVEFGTQTAEAKPFLRPALNEGKNDAFQAVTAEAQKRFDKLNVQG